MNPVVIGTLMLNTMIRARSFVVHLTGERGGHTTLPTLKVEKDKNAFACDFLQFRFTPLAPQEEGII